MRRWLALLLVVACAALAGDRSRDRFWSRLYGRGVFAPLSQLAAYVYAPFEVAPSTGLGMPASWGCVAIASLHGVTADGDAGVALSGGRSGTKLCPRPDGQSFAVCATNEICVTTGSPAATVLGPLGEWAVSNWETWSRDLSQTDAGPSSGSGNPLAWQLSNMTCTHTATGMLGDAGDLNGASTCTATGANATVYQCPTAGGTYDTVGSGFVRRHLLADGGFQALVGNVYVTIDATNWVPIGSAVNTYWRRTVPQETPGCAFGGDAGCIVVPSLYTSALQPCFGFKLDTAGDAIDIDLTQVEISGINFREATSPIITTTLRATRNADLIQATSPVGFDINDLSMRASYVGSMAHTNAVVLFLGSTSLGSAATTESAYIWTGPYTTLGIHNCAYAGDLGYNTFTATSGASTVTQVSCQFTDAGVSGAADGTSLFSTSVDGREVWSHDAGARFVTICNESGTSRECNGVVSQVRFSKASDYAAPSFTVGCGDIVEVGDSTRAGFTSSGPFSPPAALQALSGRRVWNGGVGSATIVEPGLGYLGSTIYAGYSSTCYQTLIWSLGTNDLGGTHTGAQIATAAQTTLNAALAAGRKVVVDGIIPRGSSAGYTALMDQRRLDYNAAQAAWAAASDGGARYVSLESLGVDAGTGMLVLSSACNAGDGLHLKHPCGVTVAQIEIDAGVP